jgi:hypothetical protein
LEDYEYENIGEYDFLHADRAARARVNLIRISNKTEEISGHEYMHGPSDPFVRWVELPLRVIHSIGLDKESMLKIIRQNIESPKDRFWRLVFDRIEPITQRLTKDTRNGFLGKMHQFKNLDFNQDNIYSIIIWVIENFNLYTNEQTVSLFKGITQPEYIKEYKSNRHWDKDTWRYDHGYKENPFTGSKGKGRPERYILDYRFITTSRSDKYGSNKYSIVDDLIIVLRSLGANIKEGRWVDPAD